MIIKEIFVQGKNKYKNMPIAAKASLWYIVCNVLQKGIVLLSMPIFTRLMSTSEYGIYTIYQSWYSIFVIFTSLGLYNSVYNNVLTKYPESSAQATSSMLGLSTSITAILGIVFLLTSQIWENLTRLSSELIGVMFLQMLFEPAIYFWMTRQRYEFKYKGVVALTLLNAISSTVFGVFLVLFSSEKGNSRVFAYAGTQVVIGSILYVICFCKGRTFFSKKFWKYSLEFCIPLIPHYLSFSVLSQADRIMIGNMSGKSEAAIYSVAYNIAMLMQIITNAVSNSLGPYTYQSIKTRKFDSLRKTSSMLLIVMGLGCCLVMLFSPEILYLFASKEYMAAVYIMPAVVSSTFFMFLYPLFSIIEFYFEKPKFIMIASTVGAVLNVLLNYLLIPVLGYYAAGFTTLACYILFAFAHYTFYKRILEEKKEEIEKIYDTRLIMFISIGVVAFAVLSMWLYRWFIIRYLLITIIVILGVIKRKSLINQLKLIKNKEDK
ncbi:MAG: oligosaccharide flippase family protein [Lachnospiraceae bacterium]